MKLRTPTGCSPMVLATLLLTLFSTQNFASAQRPASIRTHSASFVENLGQWDSRARFLLRTKGLDMWLTNHSLLYNLYRDDRSEAKSQARDPLILDQTNEAASITRHSHVVSISFDKTFPTSKTYGTIRQLGYYNYFLGSDSTKWVTNVDIYSRVRIESLYNGINADFYLDRGIPRYDLLVQPNADPRQIQMKIEGAEGVRVTPSGVLEIGTTLGTLELRELYAYQVVFGKQQQVSCHFILDAGNVVHFNVGYYDQTRPLVIDPLLYSIPTIGFDEGEGIAVDANGDAYITGTTESPDFPVTTGAYDQSFNGTSDVFVTKLNEDGSRLIFSTFFGGGGKDQPSSITIDASGNSYIIGTTDSSDFPVTTGAYDRSFNGSSDVFVTKLNETGNALIYSTFIGGRNPDYGRSIAVDNSGNAYITGSTVTGVYTPNLEFPTTVGAYNTSPGGVSDVFVTKLNPDGGTLIYSTLIGGRSDEQGDCIVIDTIGNAYITGVTVNILGSINNFPTTLGAYDVSPNNGFDVFVLKLNSNGSELVYSTFIGGSRDEHGIGIAIDKKGNAFITGYTSSINFPTTLGAYDVFHTGELKPFVTKLNSDGSGLIYSTFLGGLKGSGLGFCIAIDTIGNAYIAGRTERLGYQTTMEAYDTSYNGSIDAFLTKLNAVGNAIIYSTFLGGSGEDAVFGIVIDSIGDAFVTGKTGSLDYPVTPNAYDVSFGKLNDAFVTKLNAAGSALIYSTFLGGSGEDPNSDVDITDRDNPFVTNEIPLYLNASVPNPSQSMIHFNYVVSMPGEVSARLCDVRGSVIREVFSRRWHIPGTYRTDFDIEDLPSGYYLLLLCADDYCLHQQVIITH